MFEDIVGSSFFGGEEVTSSLFDALPLAGWLEIGVDGLAKPGDELDSEVDCAT